MCVCSSGRAFRGLVPGGPLSWWREKESHCSFNWCHTAENYGQTAIPLLILSFHSFPLINWQSTLSLPSSCLELLFLSLSPSIFSPGLSLHLYNLLFCVWGPGLVSEPQGEMEEGGACHHSDGWTQEEPPPASPDQLDPQAHAGTEHVRKHTLYFSTFWYFDMWLKVHFVFSFSVRTLPLFLVSLLLSLLQRRLLTTWHLPIPQPPTPTCWPTSPAQVKKFIDMNTYSLLLCFVTTTVWSLKIRCYNAKSQYLC